MAMSTRPARKRSYLAKDDRRQALLKTAAEVVSTQGWSALSMISVAERAQVSRQLVYEHFDSADDLLTQTMTQIFRDLYELTRSHVQSLPGNVAELAEVAESIVFGMPAGKARALWQMMSATYSESAETKRMSRRLRHLLTNLWTPVAQEAYDLPARESRALVWMLHMAVWGARQLVDEGEIDRKAASRLFSWMITQLQAGSLMRPVRKMKR